MVFCFSQVYPIALYCYTFCRKEKLNVLQEKNSIRISTSSILESEYLFPMNTDLETPEENTTEFLMRGECRG